MTGAKRLQGGQPCDQKSTKTGLSDSKTSALKLAVENSAAIFFPMFPSGHINTGQVKLFESSWDCICRRYDVNRD